MLIMTDEKNKILQNLKDADCNRELIERFFMLDKNQRTFEQLRLLDEYRKKLVESLHQDQRKIDCLDYLIFNLKQKQNHTKKGEYGIY